MARFRRILFPHDFSEMADGTEPFVRDLAIDLDAELHVVHAVQYPAFLDGDISVAESDVATTYDLLRNQADERLAAIRAHDPRGTTHASLVEHRSPATAILEYAEAREIELLVMATHGRTGLGRLMLGSVTAEVVRRSPVPVLVLRCPERARVPSRLRSILVPHDSSAHSDDALRMARELAERSGASLDLLHVVPEPVVPTFYGPAVTAVYDANRGPLRDEALRQLETLCAAGPPGARACRCHVKSGTPARQILKTAEELESDLVLMSSHGLTGLDRLLLGSVTERLLRTCDVPILVIKPPSED